jgi:hypothetical protein
MSVFRLALPLLLQLFLLLVLRFKDGVVVGFALPPHSRIWHNHPTSMISHPVMSSRPPAAFSSSSSALHMAPVGIRSYEDLMAKLPSQAVIDAVEQRTSGSSGVIASDVAATAGVSLSQARRELTALAALTRADLAVTEAGEVLYNFPRTGVTTALTQYSDKYKALQTVRRVWPAVFWGIRVSFGVALLASLVAIFSTIFFIQSSSSSSSSDDDRRRDNRGGGGFGGSSLGWYWGPSPFDVFYFRPYGSYGYYGTGANARDPDEMGFLESVFSYLFGDGNPNAGLEEKRLTLAAAMIRDNKGAVTAEQLAPFCDDAPSPAQVADSTYVDESFVLPIVSALGGEPVVTDDGEIVYVFTELQTTSSSTTTTTNRSLQSSTASKEAMVLKRAGMKPNSSAREIVQVLNYNGISTRGIVEKRDLIQLLEQNLPPMTPAQEAQIIESDPSVLQEREFRFSLAPDLNKFLAGGLGAVNLGGALYLGNLLSQVAGYGAQLPSYFGTVQAFYPLLLAYAVLFNVIPAARNFYIQSQNEKIRQRNARRKSWQAALVTAIHSNDRIAKKLSASARFKSKARQIGGPADTIVYNTSQPIEDTTVQKERQALEDFDKLLESEENAFQ